MKKDNTSDVIKSTQEQATAAWINEIKRGRNNRKQQELKVQDVALSRALKEMRITKANVQHLIETDRGGTKGIHGFIAEASEVGIRNARELVRGMSPSYSWINDNGPVDITHNGVDMQMKFVQENFAIGHKSSASGGEPSGFYHSVENHPEMLQQGGKLVPPKDYYSKILKLWHMTREEASRLTKGNPEGLTYANWRAVHRFFEESGVTIDDLTPSTLSYDEVQKDKIFATLEREKERIKETGYQQKIEVYKRNRPNFEEGVYATEVSAALEGGVAFCLAVAQKRKSGKQLSQFTAEDWKEVGIDTAVATTKGGIRGAAVYTLSNFTTTPANVATGYVTAVFGVVSQAKEYEKGNISKEDFVINSEAVCLDVTISAISALAGQVIVPVPVLGAIIGNIAGQFVSSICKEYAGQKEQDIIFNYRAKTAQLRKQIEKNYESVVAEVQKSFERFTSLEVLAFDKDVNVAFAGSIALAQEAGVDLSEILCTKKDIDNYFMK